VITKISTTDPPVHHHPRYSRGAVAASVTLPVILLGLTLPLMSGCGDQVSKSQQERTARAFAAVLLANQRGLDSADRVRLADSAVAVHGFDGWEDLREELADLSAFTNEFRQVLDSTQRRLDSLAASLPPDSTRLRPDGAVDTTLGSRSDTIGNSAPDRASPTRRPAGTPSRRSLLPRLGRRGLRAG
jgi:hypothetical protein